MLYLQQQLDTFDGRDGGLGNRRGHSAGDEILGERHGIRESRHCGMSGCVCVSGNEKERERKETLLMSKRFGRAPNDE